MAGAMVAGLVLLGAGGAAPLAPTRVCPLLGGRLTIGLPEAAADTPRPPDSIMSPHQSETGETRVITPLVDGKLVLFAEELYLLADPTDAPLIQDLTEAKVDAHPVAQLVGGLRVVHENPQKWVEVVEGGELVDAALVALPDHTLVRLRFLVSPGVKDKEPLRALAKASLASLKYLNKLPTGGTVQVAGVAVPFPEGWIHSDNQGPDFSVHHFRKLGHRGEAGQFVGLYEGDYPSYQHAQGDTPQPFDTEKGKWLGREVTWHVWGPDRLHEAMLEVKPGMRHVWFSGAEAKSVVDAMTLVPSK